MRTIPYPAAARGAYPWIAYEGRWGERREAFCNGPTGPNLKTQWTEPLSWSEDWHGTSHAVPGGGALGTGATDFFCSAVETGSNLVRRLTQDTALVLGLIAFLSAAVIWLASRTLWRPTTALRLARRRAWGQVVATSWRMYLGRPLLFVGIGLVAIPIAVAVSLLQAGIAGAADLVGIGPSGEEASIRLELSLAAGGILALFGFSIIQAATARAMTEIDAGRPTGVLHAYRLVAGTARPLFGAAAIAVPIVTVLALSVLLLPVAVVLAARWALFVPCIELDPRADSALGGLGRSASLARRPWPKVLSLVVGTTALVLLVGPVIGALLLLASRLPFAAVNLVAGLVYVLAMPLVGITTTYVYYDALVRERLAEEQPPPGILPAEIEATARG